MTEAEWFACTDPQNMLKYLLREQLSSDRKFRLFACACIRSVWHLLSDPRSRAAVEVAELFADGLATRNDLDAAGTAAWTAARDAPGVELLAAAWTASRTASVAASGAAVRTAARDSRANILRDIIGNPFHPVTLLQSSRVVEVRGESSSDRFETDESYCPWITPLVMSLAVGAYEERGRKCEACDGSGEVDNGDSQLHPCGVCRSVGTIDVGTMDNDRLAILGDALEEAMGDDGEVEVPQTRRIPHPLFAHLRSKGPHYRGMWSLDLLLGKV